MKAKRGAEILAEIFSGYNLQERKEHRQTSIALISNRSSVAIMSELENEGVTAFTADEVEGCFAFSCSCENLVERFDRLKNGHLTGEEHRELRRKNSAYLLILLSGVFGEIFYLMNYREDNSVQTPTGITVKDFFNYVYFLPEYEHIHPKVDTLLKLRGKRSIRYYRAPSFSPPMDRTPFWEFLLELYESEMHAANRQRQMDAIRALREIKRVPCSMLYDSNYLRKHEKESEKIRCKRLIQTYTGFSFSTRRLGLLPHNRNH